LAELFYLHTAIWVCRLPHPNFTLIVILYSTTCSLFFAPMSKTSAVPAFSTASAVAPFAGKPWLNGLSHCTLGARRVVLPKMAPVPARTPAVKMVFGLIRRNSNQSAREDGDPSIPPSEIDCACGSGKTYGRCCKGLHTMARIPRMAEELLRARYSAYAYNLPSYIMRTTEKNAREFDRRAWRREIETFCRLYRFDGGINILEENMTGPDGCSITFRANLLERGAPLHFVEMSKFNRIEGIWYYSHGKLVDFQTDADD